MLSRDVIAKPLKTQVFEDLTDGGQLVIWGLRHCMVALVRKQGLPFRVTRSFLDALGDRTALTLIADFAMLAARDADRPLQVHPPCCAELSFDEWRIANAFECCAQGSLSSANYHLCRLLGAQASAALLGRLHRIGAYVRRVGIARGSCDE